MLNLLNENAKLVCGISADNLKEYYLPERHFKMIKIVVDKVVEEMQPCEIILYGSCARSEAKFASDIDLLVITDNVDENIVRKFRLVKNSIYEKGLPDVDLHILSIESFLEKNTYNDNVRKDGIAVWKRN